jgi:hypothetical protein
VGRRESSAGRRDRPPASEMRPPPRMRSTRFRPLPQDQDCQHRFGSGGDRRQSVCGQCGKRHQLEHPLLDDRGALEGGPSWTRRRRQATASPPGMSDSTSPTEQLRGPTGRGGRGGWARRSASGIQRGSTGRAGAGPLPSSPTAAPAAAAQQAGPRRAPTIASGDGGFEASDAGSSGVSRSDGNIGVTAPGGCHWTPANSFSALSEGAK